MDPRGCSASPTTQPSPHVDSPASRTLMPNEALNLGKNHDFPHMCRVNVPVFKLSTKWTPGMFRDSNDTTLTSGGLACFENTHAK